MRTRPDDVNTFLPAQNDNVPVALFRSVTTETDEKRGFLRSTNQLEDGTQLKARLASFESLRFYPEKAHVSVYQHVAIIEK